MAFSNKGVYQNLVQLADAARKLGKTAGYDNIGKSIAYRGANLVDEVAQDLGTGIKVQRGTQDPSFNSVVSAIAKTDRPRSVLNRALSETELPAIMGMKPEDYRYLMSRRGFAERVGATPEVAFNRYLQSPPTTSGSVAQDLPVVREAGGYRESLPAGMPAGYSVPVDRAITLTNTSPTRDVLGAISRIVDDRSAAQVTPETWSNFLSAAGTPTYTRKASVVVPTDILERQTALSNLPATEVHPGYGYQKPLIKSSASDDLTGIVSPEDFTYSGLKATSAPDYRYGPSYRTKPVMTVPAELLERQPALSNIPATEVHPGYGYQKPLIIAPPRTEDMTGVYSPESFVSSGTVPARPLARYEAAPAKQLLERELKPTTLPVVENTAPMGSPEPKMSEPTARIAAVETPLAANAFLDRELDLPFEAAPKTLVTAVAAPLRQELPDGDLNMQRQAINSQLHNPTPNSGTLGNVHAETAALPGGRGLLDRGINAFLGTTGPADITLDNVMDFTRTGVSNKNVLAKALLASALVGVANNNSSEGHTSWI